jgi:hypothetical protein
MWCFRDIQSLGNSTFMAFIGSGLQRDGFNDNGRVRIGSGVILCNSDEFGFFGVFLYFFYPFYRGVLMFLIPRGGFQSCREGRLDAQKLVVFSGFQIPVALAGYAFAFHGVSVLGR